VTAVTDLMNIKILHHNSIK